MLLQDLLSGTRQLKQAVSVDYYHYYLSNTLRTITTEAMVVLWQPDKLNNLQPKVNGGPLDRHSIRSQASPDAWVQCIPHATGWNVARSFIVLTEQCLG
jgi:hypothetical protein